MTHFKVFFDADVLAAGSASQTGASFTLLHLAELGFLHAVTCRQVIDECRRNFQEKLPDALPVFEQILARTLTVYQNPKNANLNGYQTMAHPKDRPILASAVLHRADALLTFNLKHFYPDASAAIQICKPADFLHEVRKKIDSMI